MVQMMNFWCNLSRMLANFFRCLLSAGYLLYDQISFAFMRMQMRVVPHSHYV